MAIIMKVDEEKQQQEQQHVKEEPTNNRWMWVRRFIFCIILITLFMQSLAPIYFENEEDIFIATTTATTGNNQKSHIVLHTGFPPPENISGLPIYPGKAAATAFSPNPEGSKKQIDMKHKVIEGGESWWDRLFPNRHVHLVSVQLPVIPLGKKKNGGPVEATLSICASKKQRFGLGRPQIPDLTKCVDTVVVSTEDNEEDDLFGVLEWVPELTIVLQKSKLYWLVVQAPKEPFNWVYAQAGSNECGTAYETEAGWEFKLDGEPIPSAMVMVEDHHKD